MGEFLNFRKMITPAIIKILFWIGAAFCVITGLAAIAAGARVEDWPGAFGGLVVLLVGPIVVRVYCELIVIVFRIHDVLRDIRDGARGREKV